MRRSLLASGLLVCAGLAAGAQSPPADRRCRTIASAISTRSVGPGLSSEVRTKCSFDRTAHKATCTNQYVDAERVSTTSVSVTTFASLDDMLDEVRVVPPVRRSLRTETTVKDRQGTATTTLVNTYDRQNRLVKEVGASSRGTKYTTTYTNWDSAGRPTAGATVHPTGRNTLALSYRDAPPTLTTATSGLGLHLTCSQIFDKNGNPVSSSCGGNSANSRTTMAITATETVCR